MQRRVRSLIEWEARALRHRMLKPESRYVSSCSKTPGLYNALSSLSPGGGSGRHLALIMRSIDCLLPCFSQSSADSSKNEQDSRLAEHHGQRRNSTPAALIPHRGDTFTDQGSLSIEPGAEQPRRHSGSGIHHVMQQWKQENPRNEPFNSVAYYARQTFASEKPPTN